MRRGACANAPSYSGCYHNSHQNASCCTLLNDYKTLDLLQLVGSRLCAIESHSKALVRLRVAYVRYKRALQPIVDALKLMSQVNEVR